MSSVGEMLTRPQSTAPSLLQRTVVQFIVHAQVTGKHVHGLALFAPQEELLTGVLGGTLAEVRLLKWETGKL